MSVSNKTMDKGSKELRNEDPLSGESGAHPVATGLGAAMGGAAAGAVAGSVAGPVGTVVGTVVGAVAGGLAGKSVGESIDPTVEVDYWRNEYTRRPYYNKDYTFDDYEPAYRAGIDAYDPDMPADWEKREKLAQENWESEGGSPKMSWDKARVAAQDAYTRLHGRKRPGSNDTTI
jgi:hypothetical protein